MSVIAALGHVTGYSTVPPNIRKIQCRYSYIAVLNIRNHTLLGVTCIKKLDNVE